MSEEFDENEINGGEVEEGVHNYSRADRYVAPSEPQVREHLEWFRDQKLALMMHWGVYSQLGIVESWALSDEDADWSRDGIDWNVDGETFKKQYFDLNRTFNPIRFEPEKWAEAAADAGFKYCVFTTKHHDGFCMWDTKYSDYRITAPDCPFSTHKYADVCRHLFDAMRAKGLGIAAYFSKADWHMPDYWCTDGERGTKTWRGPSYDPKKDPERFERFVEFTHNQVKELASEYGRLDVLWFDAGWVCPQAGEDIRLGELMDEVRKIQPWVLSADRTVGGPYENYVTPEQCVPEEPLMIPWESCITMGTSFSFKYEDTYKSPREIACLLMDIVVKGGNLALNVGPQPDGRLPEGALKTMKGLGEWMRIYGEGIYGTRICAPYKKNDICFTAKEQEKLVYAFRMYPDPSEETAKELFIPLERDIEAVEMLETGAKVIFKKVDGGYVFSFTDNREQPIAQAFRIHFRFPDETKARIRAEFTEASQFFGSLKDEICGRIAELDGYERLFTEYLYAHMPLSDVGAFDFDIILSYARHGAYLLGNSEFLEGIDEDMFLQYVLAHRINSEDITDCRRFFYDLVHERVSGLTVKEAVLEANNWCYEQATYRSTSIRTASPVTVYKGGFGRCGEESTFLTTVLRSLGIPARQVYVPRWSHSDSNHAWVEVWCGDAWYFTGACEPKPILNNGWFPYAASRAMVVHSRLFDSPDRTAEEVTETDGLAVLLNESSRYLIPARLTVTVLDPDRKPAAGAKVRFEIVNSSEFFPIAALCTDALGKCSISLGKGDVHIHAIMDGLTAECFADLRETETVTLTLAHGNTEREDEWIPYHINAPESAAVSEIPMTPEQERMQNERNAAGDEIRNARLRSYYDKAYAEKFREYRHIMHTLKEAYGNFDEIRKFLDRDYEGITLERKELLLSTISQKDCRDITVEALEDALCAFEYEKDYPEAVFAGMLLSPRLFFETATPYRAYIREHYPELGRLVKENPAKVLDWINENLTELPDREYLTILSVPCGALKTGSCSALSKAVLFAAICVSFGVPATIDPLYGQPQYYRDGALRFADPGFEPCAKLVLKSADAKLPEYEMNFTIAVRQPDGSFETLGAWGHRFENGRFELELKAGEYRVMTCERMPSGSVIGEYLYTTLNSGDCREFDITCSVLRADEFIERHALPTDAGADGRERGSDGNGRGLLIYALPGNEPTEHVFNELLEMSRMSGFPKCDISLVLRSEESLEDPTLKKVMEAFPDMRISIRDFDDEVSTISGCTGVALRNLPYICVTERSPKSDKTDSIYCCSGYNVGCVDIFAKLIAANAAD